MEAQEFITRRDFYLQKIQELEAAETERIESAVQAYRQQLLSETRDNAEITKYKHFVASLNEMIAMMDTATPVQEEQIVDAPVEEPIKVEETPAPVEEIPVVEAPVEEVPVVEELVAEEPAKEVQKSILELFNEKVEKKPFFTEPLRNSTSEFNKLFRPRG